MRPHHDRRRTRRGRLTESQQRLAVTYIPLARALARPFKEQLPLALEEFESAALLALVESARRYDPNRGVRFATFARVRIDGALRDTRRKVLRRDRPFVMGHDGPRRIVGLPPACEEYGKLLMMHPDDPIGASLEAIEAVETWLSKLPKAHAAACRLIYLYGKTHAEAGAELGVTPSRITYMHLEALAMLNGSFGRHKRPAEVAEANHERAEEPALA